MLPALLLSSLLTTAPRAAEPVALCARAEALGWRSSSEGVLLPPQHLQRPTQLDFVSQRNLRRLLRALDSRGIELVAVVLPTIPTTVPDQLEGVTAKEPGWSPDGAIAEYRAFLDLLEDEGVQAVDVLSLSWRDDLGAPFFLPREHHWTPEGAWATARLVAGAIDANPASRDLPKARYITERRRVMELEHGGFSGKKVAGICGVALDAVPYQTWMTRPESPPQLGLLGDAPPAPVVLAGTSYSEPRFNFAGFLSQETGLDVLPVSLSAGRALSSLLLYLRSPEYAAAPPRFLVWEFPFYSLRIPHHVEVPGISDHDIYRELIPAVYGACGAGAAAGSLAIGAGEHTLFAGSKAGFTADSHYLHLQLGDTTPGPFTVVTTFADGTTERFDLGRYTRIEGNGRYFVAFDEASASPVRGVALELGDEASGQLAWQVCPYPSPESP